MPQSSLLSFDAIETFVRSVAPLGLTRLRLTGGEPLLRKHLSDLVKRLSAINEIDEIALTTNGMLLADHVENLAMAGVRRINVSLDTLSEEVFRRISRRSGLSRVLEGIEAARAIPDLELKLNALVLRDVNLDGVMQLVRFASEREIPLRFIEFMPLDAERSWTQDRMVSGDDLRELISCELGELIAVPSDDPARPARNYHFASGRPGTLGFIDSVSKPFCGDCDRLRLTADGKVRNCLFGTEEWDVAAAIRELQAAEEISSIGNRQCDSQSVDDPQFDQDSNTIGAARRNLEERLRECVKAKFAAHGIANPTFSQPQRPMYQIGG